MVGKNGRIIQLVEIRNTAWHCGNIYKPTWKLLKPNVNPNYYTIGIELEGTNNDMPTGIQAVLVSWLVSMLCDSWNIPRQPDNVLGHNQINGLKICPGRGIDVGCLFWLSQTFGIK